MARSINEGLAEAPTFTPHRVAVTSIDAALGVNAPRLGHTLDSKGYEDVVVNAIFTGGTATATVELAVWDEGLGQAILDSDFSPLSLTGNKSFRVPVRGRRFFLRVSALGAGTSLQLNVAGAPMGPAEEFA